MNLSRFLVPMSVVAMSVLPMSTGCSLVKSILPGSGNHDISAGSLSAQEYVNAAYKDTAQLKTINLEYTTLGDTKKATIIHLDGKMKKSPFESEGQIKMRLSGTLVECTFKIYNNQVHTDMNGTKATLPLSQLKQSFDVEGVLNPNRGLANLIKNLHNPKKVKGEKILGVPATQIEGTLEGSLLDKFGGDLKGQVPAKLWITQDDSHHLIQAEVPNEKKNNSLQIRITQWNKDFSVQKS